MLSAVVFDTGVLSLVADKPGKSPDVTAAQQWVAGLIVAGVRLYVPEVCDYELRRELTRAGKVSSLQRLDALAQGANYIPITTPIMRHAAQLWATARNTGRPTADDTALDGDIILCAQVLSLNLPAADYVVATTNTKHLVAFVTATEWRNITP